MTQRGGVHDMGGMNDRQTGHAMSIDDAYVVEQRLAHGIDGTTELVTLDGRGPFVRKRMPRATAHRMVWAALSECECPYLPHMQAAYEMPDEFVAVYEYVPGESLARVVEQHSHLLIAEVAPILANLCAAVAELHAHGIVHADIAPANVVLAEDGAHLIDFGIARMVFEQSRRDEKAWGTRGFAAPEQHGFSVIDSRSDIYALGRVAGYLLTGTHLAEKTYEAELRCSGLVPETVCRVLGRACAFEPSARHQTVEDFAEAFAAAVRDADVTPKGSASAQKSAVPRSGIAACNDAVSRNDADSQDDITSRTRAVSSSGARPRWQTALSAADTDSPPAPRSLWHAAPHYRQFAMVVLMALAFLAGVLGIWLVTRHATLQDGSAISAQDASGASSDDTSTPNEDLPYSDGAAGGITMQDSGSALVDQAVEDLVITDSSWYVDSSGYVQYVVEIQNTGDRVTALFPAITITGLSADGGVMFVDDVVLNELYPGETRYWGGTTGNGTGEPAAVDFTLNRPANWEVEVAHGEPTRFTVANVSTSFGQFDRLHIAGEVTLDAVGNEASATLIQLVAIGRDAQDRPVFGFSDYVSMPAEGEAVPFELQQRDGGFPDYESVDVYAYAW